MLARCRGGLGCMRLPSTFSTSCDSIIIPKLKRQRERERERRREEGEGRKKIRVRIEGGTG